MSPASGNLTARGLVALAARLGSVTLLLALGCGQSPDSVRPVGTTGAVADSTPDETPPAPDPDDRGAGGPKHVFRGIWVLCEGSERPLEDPDRIDALIENASALRVTDLFVQVYRSGRAWYDATQADSTPYDEILARTGVDGLARLLERAKSAGIRVHAWVNVLSLNANTDAPIVRDLGADSILVDRRGRSLLTYPRGEVPMPDREWYRMGTPGVYLDPGAPGVRERLVATFVELVDRYPGLDGLHLDYIRHPGVLPFVPGSRFGVGLDFGYGARTIERFQRETGARGPYVDPARPSESDLASHTAWDDWRRAQVTGLVSAIRTAVLARHVDSLISAAVIAYPDRAYLSLYQDWRGWLEDGLVDFAVPMMYSLDDRLFRYRARAFASGPGADRIWTGVGVWLFAKRPERALAQLAAVRAAGSAGVVLFSYDALMESPELRDAIVRDAAPIAEAPLPAAAGATHPALPAPEAAP